MRYLRALNAWLLVLPAVFLSACAAGPSPDVSAGPSPSATPMAVSTDADRQFEKDRAAILAMAGDFQVTFDFTETIALQADYNLKPQKLSGGHEVIRVIEDTGRRISLQHILVVGGEQKFPVKHWRQDWIYEPEEIFVFVGGNAWEKRRLSEEERQGKWGQLVYQVDDSPRYGAIAAWDHSGGISQWTPEAEWRPLPRRDMTTRDDYHAVDAVNRHIITPDGWVHEQYNTKVVLSSGEPRPLVREIGVNTYRRTSDFDVAVATDYWAETEAYWAEVRALWAGVIDRASPTFSLEVKGETEAVYGPLLTTAQEQADGSLTVEKAKQAAADIINAAVTFSTPRLTARLRPGSGERSGQ